MNLKLYKSPSKIILHLQNPLYKNSLIMMLTTILGSGFGFIFWMLAAKLYSPEDVGIATALISSAGMIVLLSRFGMDFSIIRFFPNYDKSKIFNTSVIFTTFFAIIFSLIFIFGIDIFSPELHLLNLALYRVLYVLFVATSSILVLTSISYVSIRKTEFQLIQTVITGSRILFIFFFVAFGAIGIFSSVGISFMLAFLIALILLRRSGITLKFSIDRYFLTNSFNFSAGNYLAGLFIAAPNLILPIIVLNTLGAESAAYYYIVFAITSLLFMIPNSISTSLFVEGSHGEALKKAVIKSLVAIFSLLIPAIIIIFISGGWLLEIISKSYAINGLELLRIMVFVSPLMAITSVYFSIKRIQKDIKGLIILSGLIGAMLLGLAYIFIILFGINGVGYAWLVSYGIGSIIVGIMLWWKKWV